MPPLSAVQRLLRVSVLLPFVSLGLWAWTQPQRLMGQGAVPVLLLIALAAAPALLVYMSRTAGKRDDWAVLLFLLCQSAFNSLLYFLGDPLLHPMQAGPFRLVEPGMLLLLAAVFVSWQYGWIGGLAAASSAIVIHLVTATLTLRFWPDLGTIDLPLLRPDLMYGLCLMMAYVGQAWRRQQHRQVQQHSQWRVMAATAEVLAVERERQRVAETLQHDLLHTLNALQTQLDGLSDSAQASASDAPDQVRALQQHYRRALWTTDALVARLQAAPLREMALPDALHVLMDMTAERLGLAVDMQVQALPADLPEQNALVLYHVADQALAHIAGHRHLSRINLHLLGVERGITLTLHDDGACPDRRCSGDSDLEGAEACLALLGGRLCAHTDERGNTLAVWLPAAL